MRLAAGFRLSHPTALARLLKLRAWSPVQAMLLEQLHTGLVAARMRRQKLRHYMAKEVLEEVACCAWRGSAASAWSRSMD